MAALPELPDFTNAPDSSTTGADDTTASSPARLSVVPPTGGTGHNPNLATLAQVRSHRRNALMPKSHRRVSPRLTPCTGS